MNDTSTKKTIKREIIEQQLWHINKAYIKIAITNIYLDSNGSTLS